MAETTTGTSKPVSNRQAVITHTARKLNVLSSGISSGTSTSKAHLARLRRAVNEAPGAVPEVWGITLGDLPAQLVGRTDVPSPGETAVHNALALFAVQQQGKSEFMHRQWQGLGSAVREYILSNDPQGGFDEDSPILRRFNALSTSDSVDELLWHLRSLITQLRDSSVHLDFAELAANVYDFHYPEARDRVRLSWGRQLYTTPRQTAPTNSTTSSVS